MPAPKLMVVSAGALAALGIGFAIGHRHATTSPQGVSHGEAAPARSSAGGNRD